MPEREPADRSELQPELDQLDAIDDDQQSLAMVLAAARAAGRPDELRGEEAAVAAFHSARFDPPSPRPGPPGWARVLTVKAVVLAFLVGVASVALAAGVRVVIAPASSQDPGLPSPAAATTPAPVPRPATRPSTAPPQTAPATGSAATGTTAADLADLCRAYRRQGPPRSDDSATSSPDPALVAAAGGNDEVAAFCAHLDAGAANHQTHTPAPPGAYHHSPSPSTGPSYPSSPTNGG